MTFEEICRSWERDSYIDENDLARESLASAKLHCRYYPIFCEETLKLRCMESEHKRLRLQKYEFYLHGQTEETKRLGWKLPPKGMILKSDVSMYLEADPDILAAQAAISAQAEKVSFLDSIIKNIASRVWQIRAAVDYLKFANGG